MREIQCSHHRDALGAHDLAALDQDEGIGRDLPRLDVEQPAGLFGRAGVFLLGSMVFVYRSFYGMRIESGK